MDGENVVEDKVVDDDVVVEDGEDKVDELEDNFVGCSECKAIQVVQQVLVLDSCPSQLRFLLANPGIFLFAFKCSENDYKKFMISGLHLII
ncbi:MAG: hypothetical protein KDD45_12970 [Bdellovibrionales bacterium]|nr:hypothetical protein [Bdellovibrionales bacterium]